MRTAEDCRRQAAMMNLLAAQSPALSDQYLRMAQLWERLGHESAQIEGLESKQPSSQEAPSSIEAPFTSLGDQPASLGSGDDGELA